MWCTQKENCNYGNHNRKISESRKGAKNVSAWKPVFQFSVDGVFIRKWDSVAEAGNAFKPKYKHMASSISQCCRGIIKQAGGYVWKYVNLDVA